MINKIIDNSLSVVFLALVALVSFFITSFAKNESLKDLEFRVKTLENNSDRYAKKSELELVLSGLCIIDERTCKLKKRTIR